MRLLSRTAMAVTVALASALSATPALAAPAAPTVVHFGPITGTFPNDEILTPACGFPVTGSIYIEGVEITFDSDGNPSGVVYLETYRNQATFTANGNTVVFIERGHFSVRLLPDSDL